MKLNQKVAIITGGASGIGKAASMLFAEQGAYVVIADIDSQKGHEVVKEIISKGYNAEFIETNISNDPDIKNLIDKTVEQFGKVDILFNNAGISHPFQLTETIEDSLVDKMLAVNIKGPFLCCKYVIPIMKKQKSGNILFTSSMTGIRPMAGTNLYATTKGAEIIMAKALAIELAKDNIRVNAIAPVAVDTPMLNSFVLSENKEKARSAIIEKFPIERLVLPEEVAKAALYLASDDAQMITGSVIQLDGGRGI